MNMARTEKCPHCLVTVLLEPDDLTLPSTEYTARWIEHTVCPSCARLILWLAEASYEEPDSHSRRLMYPKASGRSPVPLEVPAEFSEDYVEACLVLSDSPKASAALSRRCLQHILRDKAGVKHSNLANEIQEVLDSNTLPSPIAQSLDMVRQVGNFAAHPNKSTQTGEIVPVESHEAEWCLDVIEMLFDFYFVQPEEAKRRLAAIQEKFGPRQQRTET